MRRYLTKKQLVLLVVMICFVALFLFGCSTSQAAAQNDKYNQPIDTWTKESGMLEAVLVWPFGWLMHLIGNIFPSGWGQVAFAILFTTIIVRTLAWPIYAKTNDMSLKMSVAQPEINKLQQKYANRKDPQSQRRMQQEMMAIYKKYKINLFGCLMPFVQMPLFLAMYQVVRRIYVPGGQFSLTDTSFLGIDSCLSQGAWSMFGSGQAEAWTSWSFWMGIILSLAVGGTMFLLNTISQKQPSYVKKNNNPNQNPNQTANMMKIMNYVMIGMMVFASLSSNALAFYWVVGNVYSIVQTLINRKINEKKYYKMRSEVDELIG